MAQHLQAAAQATASSAGAFPEGMQFRFNSDYPPPPPGYASAESASVDPPPFPPAQIDPCARLTTRVYVPKRNQVVVVRDVLVGTAVTSAAGGGVGSGAASGEGGPGRQRMSCTDADDGSESDDDSDDSWDDTDSDMDEDDAAEGAAGGFSAAANPLRQQQPHANEPMPGVRAAPPRAEPPKRAYWLQRTLREAIYGRVKYAVVLRRRAESAIPLSQAMSPDGGGGVPTAEWEVTDEKCAVKEMSWNHIRRERSRLAEDPIKEVSAMQHLSRYHQRLRDELRGGGGGAMGAAGNDDYGGNGSDAMMDTHIMMPLDLLSDDRFLYSVMPYCNGGELFDRLDERQKFTEDESRYWMHQILSGVENLQRAGVCHRDMSLENLLVHNERLCLIIDMGMCLRIPYETEEEPRDGIVAGGTSQEGNLDTAGMMNSFAEMSVERVIPSGAGYAGGAGYITTTERLDHLDRRKNGVQRYLMRPQGTCGKWHYMSPEIAQNKTPFDGHAVDMWATGVILFLMLTGFPPWERPCKSDDRFKYMTAGYLVQMLTEWELGLSPDAMDLLQRMLWIDPRDRLSLEQVRAHPWMVNGRMEMPAQSRAAAFVAGGIRG